MKYHFLNGKTAETKEFKNDEDAIAAAQKDKGVIRVQNDSTLKYVHEVAAAVAKAAALLIACLLIGLSANAATVIGVIGAANLAGYVVNSASGGTNTSLATNGLYSSSIAAATTETNLVCITPGGFNDMDMVVQLTANGTSASTTNTVAFLITSSALPVVITNSTALGNGQSGSPRGTFATYTLALNGTTAVTTNIVLSHYSSPAVGKGLNLYLESVAVNAGSSSATNYSIAVVP
jgi:hypothetical protein